jgi:hypothetical protein
MRDPTTHEMYFSWVVSIYRKNRAGAQFVKLKKIKNNENA